MVRIVRFRRRAGGGRSAGTRQIGAATFAVVLAALVVVAAGSARPPKPGDLVVKSFPQRLLGSLELQLDRTHGEYPKQGSWHRKVTIDLTDVSLRRTITRGLGLKRAAEYAVTGARATVSGYYTSASVRKPCRMTSVRYALDATRPVTGTLAIFGPNHKADGTFGLRVPTRVVTTVAPCGSSKPISTKTTKEQLAVDGTGSLALSRLGDQSKRFRFLVNLISSTKGPFDAGGYLLNGSFAPPPASAPVVLCRYSGGGLECPAPG
jgi:hypothetical protein